jgi:thioredoxin-like negative regulator of GroEL
MRPQLGMTALLLLMIGSSLILLRTHPGERELVQVTERGVPEGEVDNANVHPGREPNRSPTAALSNLAQEPNVPKIDSTPQNEAAPPSSLLESARKAFAEERYDEAHDLAEQVIVQGGSESANAALISALSISKRSGCSSALARFEALRIRYNKTSLGEEAAFRAAECHVDLGQIERARALFEQLKNTATWGARARQRLASLPANSHANAAQGDASVDN